MAAPLPPLSASVTRILALTGFPPELKTKDIQAAFSEWDGVGGGFKIKWVDDTSLLLVFADAGVAKRAYLQTILSPPPSLTSPTSALTLSVKPYDGSDAQSVIYTVNNRRTNNARGSVSIPNNAHVRGLSSTSNDGSRNVGGAGAKPTAWKNGLAGSIHAPSGTIPENVGRGNGGDVSPTLPSLVSQPTLNSLINSSLSDINSPSSSPPPTNTGSAPESAPPRVGDPARRMVGAALGVKHPGIAPKSSPDRRVETQESPVETRGLNKAMGGMVIAE